MNPEDSARQDALEQAQRIHAEQIVMDSLAPTFTCEMMLTPDMVEMARRLQQEGKTYLVGNRLGFLQVIERLGVSRHYRQTDFCGQSL